MCAVGSNECYEGSFTRCLGLREATGFAKTSLVDHRGLEAVGECALPSWILSLRLRKRDFTPCVHSTHVSVG